jgi:probable HAF family extracellular repeat protein
MVGCVLSAQTPNSRIEELYLNYRDYGALSPGLNAASSYFFQRPMNTISENDARFLLARETMISDPFSDSDKYPKVSQNAPTQYDYDEFPISLPQCYSILHDGSVNGSGKAVSTMLISAGDLPFLCYRDKDVILKQLLDASASRPFCINDKDQSVGVSYGADGNQHAVIWDSRGMIRDIGALPGYSQNIARCINNKGQIVGYAFSSETDERSILSTATRAFLWQNGHMTDLGVPQGYIASRAYGINDKGQIAGWVLTRDRAMHAMVWEHGHMQDIGTLGGEVSAATSINNRGQVVGDAQRKDGTVGAFLWENGVMHDLGNFPGDIRARAWSINDSGEVVGLSFGSDLYGPGGGVFVWDSLHGMRDLIPMLMVSKEKRASLNRLCTVFSINDSGQILGVTLIGRRHMFLLNPRSTVSSTAAKP